MPTSAQLESAASTRNPDRNARRKKNDFGTARSRIHSHPRAKCGPLNLEFARMPQAIWPRFWANACQSRIWGHVWAMLATCAKWPNIATHTRKKAPASAHLESTASIDFATPTKIWTSEAELRKNGPNPPTPPQKEDFDTKSTGCGTTNTQFGTKKHRMRHKERA